MKKIVRQSAALLGLLLACALPASAQTAGDPAIDAAGRKAVLERLLAKLDGHYVFIDQLPRIKEALRRHADSGAYDRIASSAEYGRALSAHLLELTRDKHMSVKFSLAGTGQNVEAGKPADAELARLAEGLRRRNYDFPKVEIMEGNVGYLKIDSFKDPRLAGNTATAAMTMVLNSDALIIDLRDCRGGGMLYATIASYLFNEDSVGLTAHVYRDPGNNRQIWTQPHVPGPRYAKPVYLLTSPRTFSACEALTASLRDLKRATVIGEPTRGGANTVAFMRLDEHFVASVPVGTSRTIETGFSWEGTGVPPDVAVPEQTALAVARRQALETLAKQAPDAQAREALAKALAALPPAS